MASFWAFFPPSSSSTWLPESATEWIASASIELTPVRKNATNFVTAIPRLASSAATTALVPPSADMRGRLSGHMSLPPAGDAMDCSVLAGARTALPGFAANSCGF